MQSALNSGHKDVKLLTSIVRVCLWVSLCARKSLRAFKVRWNHNRNMSPYGKELPLRPFHCSDLLKKVSSKLELKVLISITLDLGNVIADRKIHPIHGTKNSPPRNGSRDNNLQYVQLWVRCKIVSLASFSYRVIWYSLLYRLSRKAITYWAFQGQSSLITTMLPSKRKTSDLNMKLTCWITEIVPVSKS